MSPSPTVAMGEGELGTMAESSGNIFKQRITHPGLHSKFHFLLNWLFKWTMLQWGLPVDLHLVLP